MPLVHVAGESRGLHIHQARERFFDRGEVPAELLDETVLRSWQRCRNGGLDANPGGDAHDPLTRIALKEEQERNRVLVSHAQGIMEHVYEHIRDSGSMVILADANGLLLQCVGDPDFLDRASRVALQPGSSWDESQRGTNAIGTALVEELPVEVFGSEHFFDHNSFLTCTAAPLRDSQGRLMGVLDISGDYRSYQRHTRGLVRMSAQLMENRLFEFEQAGRLIVCFHSRAEHLGSLGEGMLAVSPDGRVTAVNQIGLELLGLRRCEVVSRDFSMLFETQLGTIADHFRQQPQAPCTTTSREGRRFFVRLRGDLPSSVSISRVVVDAPVQSTTQTLRPRSVPAEPCRLSFEALCTGDARVQMAVDKARRIIGRDIPILIQGESGAGKEMFAKSFHNSGPRSVAPFVALNCAAIPENLIESELFGYRGGAFTGARKEGALGKIQQADGGTLFLDEIGDMPLSLQARLLRVLQERCVTPLGSSKPIPVDISLVCATHRRLREEVNAGNFREDLYYRLNGLCITLPALRERTDLRCLVNKLLTAEIGTGRKIAVAEDTLQVFERYAWPGNIRQMHNVLRVAVALLDDDEDMITTHHLPEEMLEPVLAAKAVDAIAEVSGGTGSVGTPANLEELERQTILRVLEAEGGNISSAARKLGISRNTLYRKIGRL